ncbi:flavin reductase [Streptomyces sp. NP160]|uniref:flavin reductase family protein n=1 Tax=Streptomyces sp. NP160 TaxID=2586637 RepID=UPI00111A7B33|nr:flavin reductase family protein [Streptomyces sp. NP160]TNM68426.1 flavin reductase [Streptomyces sp. NP160]
MTVLRPVPVEGSDAVRAAFSRYPTGVAVLAAVVDGEPTAVVASSFQVGISLDPPLVLFAVMHGSRSWSRLAGAPVIGASVLGAGQGPLARQLAAKDVGARFTGVPVRTAASGALRVEGGPVWMECTVHDTVTAGDHDVVLLRVRALVHEDDAAPLVWHASTFGTTSMTAA